MPDQVGAGETRSASDRIALVVTDVSSPGLVVAAILVAVAWHSAASAAEAVVIVMVSVIFAAGIPYAYLAWRLRHQGMADRHVHSRSDRLPVLLTGLVSTSCGALVLIWIEAPPDILALIAAMVAGLLVVSTLTRWWKVSLHMAVSAGAVTVGGATFGTSACGLLPLLAAIAWARYHLGHHSIRELAGGLCAGAIVAAAVFLTLR